MRSGWSRSSGSSLLTAAVALLALAGCGGGGASSAGTTASTGSAATQTPAATPARRAAPPAVVRARGSYRGAVPILMYHVVHGPPAGTPYPELWVRPGRFTEQMVALRDHGYRGVTLDQVWEAWHGGPALPSKPVVVSFDDGYLSQYQHAAKTLKALHWPGVLNLEVKNLGLAGGLSRRQVEEMARDGWEIDAHSVTHPDLTTVGAAQLERETAGARRILQRRLHLPVRFFCYPAGRFDATVEAAVKAAGYRGATTELPGAARPGGDAYALPRVRVNGSDTGQAVVDRVRASR